MRSFRRAEELGADALELDLRVTADNELVVIHDATVDRTTQGGGPVADLTLAQLRVLDAGLGEHIPTFDEVLRATTLPIQAELKTGAGVGPLIRLLSVGQLFDRVWPICFDAVVLERVRAAAVEVKVGLIASEASADVVDRAVDVGASLVSLGAASVSADIVALCREANLLVSVWTVDEPAEMRRLRSLGIDAIVTNRPDVLAQVLHAE